MGLGPHMLAATVANTHPPKFGVTGASITHRRGKSVPPAEQELSRRTEKGGKLSDLGFEGQVGLVDRWGVRRERHFRRGNHRSESSQNSPVTKVWAGAGGR